MNTMKKQTLELIEKIKKDLKEMLSESRYNHSISVMNKAIELAKIYGVDEDKAALAGLAHDIAKEIPDEEALKLASDNNVEIDDFIKNINHKLLHGKIGAVIVKQRYGFDEQIQKAIEFHTEGTPDFDMLGKIVFVADKTEDLRKGPAEIDIWRKISKEDIDEAIIQIINFNIKKLIEEKRLIDLTCILTRNKLMMNRHLSY